MSVNIQVLSDLHLESPKAYDVFEISPVAPYLALLGDIGYTTHVEFFEFLRIQLRRFEAIFFVLAIMNRTNPAGPKQFIRLRIRGRDISNRSFWQIYLLESDSVPVEQHENVSLGLNDFYRISEWTVDAHNACHQADLHWLNEQASEMHRTDPDRKIVVLTHHSPTTDVRTINPRNVASKISSGFMTDLTNEACWLTGNVHTRVFGHSHYNCDLVDGKSGMRLVTNQRGYYFAQAHDFAAIKVMQI